MRKRMSAPAGPISTRSTWSRMIRACSAGNSSSHNGSQTLQRLARFVLCQFRQFGARRHPCANDYLWRRSSALTWVMTAALRHSVLATRDCGTKGVTAVDSALRGMIGQQGDASHGGRMADRTMVLAARLRLFGVEHGRSECSLRRAAATTALVG